MERPHCANLKELVIETRYDYIEKMPHFLGKGGVKTMECRCGVRLGI